MLYMSLIKNTLQKSRRMSLALALTSGLMAAPLTQAIQLGDTLAAFELKSSPQDFKYAANGQPQLILVYPLSFSARHHGKFTKRLVAEGFCPMSIVDMKNRAWYAPLSLAEKELTKEMAAQVKPECSVTADYEGLVNERWALDGQLTTIVVNGGGEIIFLSFGVLNKAQEDKVIALLADDDSRPLTALKKATEQERIQ